MAGEAPARSSFFQRFLLPGLAFKAVVIGGGYATGRELVEFFMGSGPLGGLLGMLLAMIVWSLVCALTFLFARAVAARPLPERVAAWNDLARDLVPRSRLVPLAALEAPDGAAVSRYLSATDLYRVGRRLAAAPAADEADVCNVSSALFALAEYMKINEAARVKAVSDSAAKDFFMFCSLISFTLSQTEWCFG